MSWEEKFLWVEKYRPKDLKDLVVSDEYRKIFDTWISNQEIPNVIFEGPPGSGKTTLGRILVSKVLESRTDLLQLNGSASTSVEIVRNVIEEFCSAPRLGEKAGIVFIDEFEYMSTNAQAALRNMIETYHSNVRFLFTCNFLYKVIEPLQSRCQTFNFKKLPLDYVKKYVIDILGKEKIEYDENSIYRIVSLYYPDIRKIVNTIQSRVYEGKISSDINSIESIEKKIRSYVNDIVSYINDGKFAEATKPVQLIIKTLSENEIDFMMLYEELFFDNKTPIWIKPIVNDYCNKQQNNCASNSMNFMACIFEIIRAGNEISKARAK